MSDKRMIYAEDAIDALAHEWDGMVTSVFDVIKSLPSAQRWIPVSERLPEEKQDVLLAFKHNMVVGFWEDILDNGEPAWYANSGDGWMTGTESVDSDGIPIAWMPLPEPYKS